MMQRPITMYELAVQHMHWAQYNMRFGAHYTAKRALEWAWDIADWCCYEDLAEWAEACRDALRSIVRGGGA